MAYSYWALDQFELSFFTRPQSAGRFDQRLHAMDPLRQTRACYQSMPTGLESEAVEGM
jgi:hypothetical protein